MSRLSSLVCVNLDFIGGMAQSAPWAVVCPSALGNTLVCLQQLELQRGRGESAALTCSCGESVRGKEEEGGGQGQENGSICRKDDGS